MSTSKLHIAIVILASEKSSQMQETKQMLPWGNSTLLGHIIKEVVKTQINDLYVVLGVDYTPIFDRHKHFPVKFIECKPLKNNYILSVKQIINEIPTHDLDGVLFLSADQPEVDHLHLKDMIYSFTRLSKAIVATKEINSTGYPILFDKSYFSQISTLTNPLELRKVIQENLDKTIKLVPSKFFTTLNTYEEYLQMHNDWFGETSPN